MKQFIRLSIYGIILMTSTGKAGSQLSDKAQFDVAKNLSIYNALFKELILHYVDSIPPQEIIQKNINYTLQLLDPYNEYISEDEIPEFILHTTGEYGGIGAVIASDSNNIYVAETYVGMPANKAGLQAGDVIVEINGEKMTGKQSSFASEKLKGQPNTTVKIQFQRYGEKSQREAIITRERIEIDPVTHYDMLTENVGYIYLASFTTHSAQQVLSAINGMKKNHDLKALIIDLSDNGGGVLEDCLKMLNFFIPKGKLLMTMKGKYPEQNREFYTTQNPVEPDIPLAVIVSKHSASASEIFAGTLQDLDRAIIVGNKTYGKGLVQSTFSLPYNGQLKLTTAKYYIPSGRCIQAVNYSTQNNGSGLNIPDSLTNIFYTANGREVRDGGGITPDILIQNDKTPTMIYYLDNQNMFFNFVVQWRQKHPHIAKPETFTLSDSVWMEFVDYVKKNNFAYDRQSEKALNKLREIMEFEGYINSASDELKALSEKLKPDLDRDLNLYRKQISDILAQEIIRHYYLAQGSIIYSLRNNNAVKKAIDALTCHKSITKDVAAASLPCPLKNERLSNHFANLSILTLNYN
ncbi:MAG: S41 family peptidase [Tannerella sp.]|jgi:carboxyl-terminal processing protease|nr:S41 family peptidase [Tannerella sp.]